MTIVFGPDTFTVGADIALASYPSGSPKYAITAATSGAVMTVNATNDRVQLSAGPVGMVAYARCTDATMPTGDQDVTATCYLSGAAPTGGSFASVTTRSDAGTGAVQSSYHGVTWEGAVEIYREDAGSSVLLVSTTRTFANGAGTMRMRATGTNPVALELQVAGTAVITASDSTANRRTTGNPGLKLAGVIGTAFVDDFKVDNLKGAKVYLHRPLRVWRP